MKRTSLIFLSLVSLVVGSFAFAADQDSLEKLSKCVTRVKDVGCTVSNNDYDRIDANVTKCRHVEDKDGMFDVFLLNESGKAVIIDTDGYNKCNRAKYTLDAQGITDFKVIGNQKEGVRVFFLGNSGRVYVMDTDQVVYEILSGNGNSYTNVSDIKGVKGSGTSVQIVMDNGKNGYELTRDKLDRKLRTAGAIWSTAEARRVNFRFTTTYRSLLRDE